MSDTDGAEYESAIEPKERCPKCWRPLQHASKDPLEEYCIDANCDYYRAEVAGGKVVRE